METGKINSEPVEQNMIFTKVDDWSYFNVYLKSDIRYIRFEYPPNGYNNDTLKTNELIAGDTRFTGSIGKNKPYKIIKHFIDNKRFERFDDNTESSRTKSIFFITELSVVIATVDYYRTPQHCQSTQSSAVVPPWLELYLN